MNKSEKAADMLDNVARNRRQSLKQRVINASSWSVLGYGANQAIRFVTNLIMTRLLVPDMFGVMAIATVILVGLAMFSDLGLKQSIVQSKRGGEPTFLNTAWVVQILRGMLLCLISIVIAVLVGVADWFELFPKQSVYADARLPFVIAMLSLVSLLNGFGSTKMDEAGRVLALRRVTLVEVGTQVAGALCMLIWAVFDRSIWTLTIPNLLSSVAWVLLTHFYLPGNRNRWQWDSSAFHEIFHFGKWIFLSSIMAFFVNNGDRLMLGGMIETRALGIYSVAFAMVSAVETVLARVITSVTFPALGEIARERPHEFKKTYYRLHAAIAPTVYFCSGVLIAAGPSLVGMLYDPRYAAAGWMLQILAVALLALPFQIALQAFMVLGLPQITTKILTVRLTVLLIAMPIGFHFLAMPGALWGIAVSQYACLPVIIYYSMRHDVFDLRRELLALPAVFFGMGAGKLLAFLLGS